MLKLQRPVCYDGVPFWGIFHPAPSHLLLSPNADPNDLRWYWQFSSQERPLEISPDIVDSEKRRIRLIWGNHALEIFEHLGALRHQLLGVTVSGTRWGPYAGSAAPYLRLLKDACVEYPEDRVRWHTVSEVIRHSYNSNRGGDEKAYTEIRPTNERRLCVTVTCAYKGLGSRTRIFHFSCPEELNMVYATPTQGWPRRNYYLSRLASAARWPYHSEITWPQEHSRSETLDLFIQHRALDILGALSLLCRDGLFAANVTSYCSGHEADVQAVTCANQLLRQL